ncbi:hypothetical protein WJ35_06000 [Burkholderia ubonensis]|uniref:Addiction module toxin RelE n=1 Tax=Burkholderia ubonensis TaxID=101571 RepID=A0A1B4LC19_9BURK|nr:hypothetical protein WJ35_06000 [Burkholderia ubonensis]AOK09735.1 hypothetical protein WK31_05500 [Burkholderia vietnamiensis]
MAIKSIRRKARFQKEYDGLTDELRGQVDDALRDLMSDPIPAGRRFHSLNGFKNPKIYTIDVTSNKAYKISVEIDGTCATLRRVATHREIDRAP